MSSSSSHSANLVSGIFSSLMHVYLIIQKDKLIRRSFGMHDLESCFTWSITCQRGCWLRLGLPRLHVSTLPCSTPCSYACVVCKFQQGSVILNRAVPSQICQHKYSEACTKTIVALVDHLEPTTRAQDLQQIVLLTSAKKGLKKDTGQCDPTSR